MENILKISGQLNNLHSIEERLALELTYQYVISSTVVLKEFVEKEKENIISNMRVH